MTGNYHEYAMRIVLVIFCFCTIGYSQTEFREWTRESDSKTIKAELVSFDPATGKVRLSLESGKEVELDQGIFTTENRSFLEAHVEKLAGIRKAAEKPRMETATPGNGGGHALHIYKPAGYLDMQESERNRPIAFLYSAGGNSKGLVNLLKPAADELGWLLVGIDAYRNTSSLEERYKERMQDTKAAFEWTRENLVFDESKIVFGGNSGGGWWAYQSAAELTNDAAGILSFVGWMGNMHDKRYSKKMAVAMINGDKDKNALIYEESDGDFLRKRADANVKAFHFPGGHVTAPAPVALEAARWIHETKGFGPVGGKAE